MTLRCLLPLLLIAQTASAGESLLGNGNFEIAQDEQPLGWGIQDAARSRDGELRSAWRLVHDKDPMRHHAVQLAGTAHTAIWTAVVSQEFAVVPGDRLLLKGSIKTKEVRRELSQFQNCNLALRFEAADGRILRPGGSPVQATRMLTGTQPWTEVSKVAYVPDGATQARVLCFLSMSGVAWFDDISVERMDPPAWIVTPGKNFTFHHLDGDELPDWARARTEANLKEMEKELGLKVREPIDFFKYPDNATKAEITGKGGNAHVGPGRNIHTVWRVDRHEIVHVLMKQIGDAETALFGEGIAVCLTGPWQDKDVDEHVRAFAAAGTLPRIPDMVEYGKFAALGDSVSYPVSGSFVKFLLAKAGLEKFKEAYPLRGAQMDAERFKKQFAEVYGGPLEQFEDAWLRELGLRD